jgi:putative Mg2+ transporter-C (MgtC) family protein
MTPSVAQAGWGVAMDSLVPVNPVTLWDTFTSLALALALGLAVGVERQYRERIASLRTPILVAIGACQFVDMGLQVGGADQAMRVVANLITGVGFLGAGLIMREGANVRGLSSAATVWCAAAIGACAGANMPGQAVLLTLFVLFCNAGLRPLVKAIDRLPVRDQAVEAHYEVFVVVPPGAAPAAREALLQALAAAKYPAEDVREEARTDAAVRVVADLISTSVEPGDLDAAAAALRRLPGATDAGWIRSGVR